MRFFVPKAVVIDRAPRQTPHIALTIDDGPDALCEQILAALKKAEIPATFFCVGHKLQGAPDCARAILAAGHEIQNHTYSHGHALAFASSTVNADDLRKARTIISAMTSPPRYFRAVAGMVSPPIVDAAKSVGLSIVHWSATARDGGPIHVSAQTALKRLERGLIPGGILVLHDRAGQSAAEVIPLLAARAQARGLRFLRLSELLT